MTSTPRRVGVLGTFVWDTIHHPDRPGAPIEQWGGLAYCLSAWSAACPPGWEVVPVAMVGEDLADHAKSFLSRLPHIVHDGSVEAVPEPNNRVELRYRDAAVRTELLTGGVPPWTLPRLSRHLSGLDALYVNHMSGMEMDVETALGLVESFRGPIYADLHSLFLEPPRGRPRAPRRLPDWERWLRTADVVQLNESELALLGPEEGGSPSPMDLLREGPSVVLVTRGAAGAEYATRAGSHPIESLSGSHREAAGSRHALAGAIPLAAESLPGDPTGCGDVWGSVTFAGLLEERRLEDAMRRAHVAAAARLRHGRIDGLATAIASALRAYDDLQ